MAQRITRPQLCVAALCTALHWPLTYLLMVSYAGLLPSVDS